MSAGSRARFAAGGLVLLGFSLGVLADRLWQVHFPRVSTVEPTHEESMYAMLGSLGLTDEQDEAIKAILDRYRDKVEEHLAAVHPVLLSTMDSARHEIEVVLDARQRETFHDWLHAEHDRLGLSRRSLIHH